jgi:carbamoyltransferase
LWTPQTIRNELCYDGPIVFAEHHMSHAASAFLVSPFKEAAILTADEGGEWDTTTLGVGTGNEIHLLKSLVFPHSLGTLYLAFAYYLGYKVNSAEYEVMSLASYGKPLYYDLILKELISLKDDGSFRLNMKYFAFDYSLKIINYRFHELFGAEPRKSGSPIEQFHMDVAASIQKVMDEVIIRMSTYLHKETGINNLCLAGGVALNCISNSKIFSSAGFEDIFIQPAAGDAGGAVGVAYYVDNTILHHERNYVWKHNFLGPSFSNEKIESQLKKLNIIYHTYEQQELLKKTAILLSEQKIVGWFQGSMEYGPHALGARCILADPRNPENYSRLNMKIKFRESARPFASTVLIEHAQEYFEFNHPSPDMLYITQVKKDRRMIPAVTHVDGSARFQTLERDYHPLYYDLIAEFKRLTDCPILINTSFNVSGETIVCTPLDAIRCFLRTDMDNLIIGGYIVDKDEIINSHRQIYLDDEFKPE